MFWHRGDIDSPVRRSRDNEGGRENEQSEQRDERVNIVSIGCHSVLSVNTLCQHLERAKFVVHAMHWSKWRPFSGRENNRGLLSVRDGHKEAEILKEQGPHKQAFARLVSARILEVECRADIDRPCQN